MSNLDEKLREILEESFTGGWHATIERKLIAIKKAIREALPEKKPTDLDGNSPSYIRDCIKWGGGFNSCLKEVEDILK